MENQAQATMHSYEVRYRVPYCDREQNVYGFKFKTVRAESEAFAKAALECLAFDIHITKVPTLGPVTSNVCIGSDPLCPCQDGDMCHYKGPDAWPIPTARLAPKGVL